MQEIVGRKNEGVSKVTWVPDDGTLPMRKGASGKKAAGIVAIVVGLAWIYFCYTGFEKTVSFSHLSPDLFMMVFLSLPGIFILLYGISQLLYFEETTIDRDGVTFKRRGLTGMREWREAISSYRGVLKKHQHVNKSGASARGRYMVYSLVLAHGDPAREVELYLAESSMFQPPPEYDKKWKDYAKLFRLPVLEKTEEGETSRSVGELDEPLVKKIGESKLKVDPIDPLSTKLGLMASVERSGDLWVVTCSPIWTIWKSILGVLILTAALLASNAYGIIHPGLSRYFMLVIPLCVVAIGFSIQKKLNEPEQVAIDEDRVYYRYRDKKKGWVTEDIPLDSVTSISIKTDPSHFRSAPDIVIEGKKRNIRFGWWLPRKTKVRVKKVLLSIISTSMPA